MRLAREVVRDFVPRAMDKRIDLGYEGPDADAAAPRIVGQPMLVRELIRNLVDNALLYTPAGGTVTVRLAPEADGQALVLQVEDTGPGIPEGEREQVFQPFYRALGTDVDGSGLGLAIVKEIADKHAATVTIAAARTHAPGGGRGARARCSWCASRAQPATGVTAGGRTLSSARSAGCARSRSGTRGPGPASPSPCRRSSRTAAARPPPAGCR